MSPTKNPRRQNSPERAEMLAGRAEAQRNRRPDFTPIASKRVWPREHNVAFFTKRWTPSRIKQRDEWLKNRRDGATPALAA